MASTSDEGKAVRTLVKIVLDKEGRAFILELERNCAELCMEVLDRVSRDPIRFLPAASDCSLRASRSTHSKPKRNRLSLSR